MTAADAALPVDAATQHDGRIRSFHARRGRVGPRAQDTLDRLRPLWGIDLDTWATGDLQASTPVVVEVGCGHGEATVGMAVATPGTVVVGVDVHSRGLAVLLRAVESASLTNVRVWRGDAVDLLHATPTASLAGVRVYFPDPWPKARHHKRRLIQPDFVALVADRLAPGGLLHAATDVEDYAEQMLSVLDAEPLLTGTPPGLTGRDPQRPVTRYETRGVGLGHRVQDVRYARVMAEAPIDWGDVGDVGDVDGCATVRRPGSLREVEDDGGVVGGRFALARLAVNPSVGDG